MNKANEAVAVERAELLDAVAVAKRLSLGVRTIWRWADAGRLPMPVQLGRLRRWRAADIDRWIADGCRPVEVR